MHASLPAHRHTPVRWLRAFLWGLLLCASAASAFDLQGHRGARGLAPENTLAGFERALAIGVTTLELDVVITADGVPVISHDTVLNPDITRDARGRWLQERNQPIHQLTLAELQAWDVGRINPASRYARDLSEQEPRDGQRIPTLAALFERVQQLGATQVRFNIETKLQPGQPEQAPAPEAFVRAVLDVVRAHSMQRRVSLQSFDWRTLKACQQLAPEVPVVHLTAQVPRMDNLSSGEWTQGLRLDEHRDAPGLVAAAGGKIWSPHFGNLSQQSLRRARALGLRVLPWTVNETADMERLLDWGVDGLITDHPERLRALMQQRGMSLPPALTAPAQTAQLGPR